ncbi:hypothetical protein KJ742_02755 [Patescibacteria group bacterium]|nr:hypothetical protein [Patescibacteria group bacterium]
MELPLFSEEVSLINSLIGYAKREGKVYYFNGQMPLFIHDEKDGDSFKMFMAQLYVTGNATQSEINKAFGMNPINMKRWVKKYKEEGAGGFYRKTRERKARVMTKEVLNKVGRLMEENYSLPEIAEELEIKVDTLRKAIREGKLKKKSR